MFPDWVNQYMTIPFVDLGRDRSGVDCWGLVRLILIEQRGIELPSFTGDYPSCEVRHIPEMNRVIFDHWPEWAVKVDVPDVFDLVLAHVGSRPVHIGMLIAPNWMLHAEAGSGVVRERLDGMKWRHGTPHSRVEGFYRVGQR